MNQNPYHYRQCGLKQVYLRNGFTRESTPPYGETIKIHDIDGLHLAIGMYLTQTKGVLTGPEIRFLRHELDLSQKMLGSLLGKSDQTVARWEKDRSPIDETAARLLRAYYDAKRGSGDKRKIASLLEELSELDSIEANDRVDFLEDKDAGGWKRADAA